ncbi:MAG: GDP-mannose 4,6-dehydratase [Candidatus Methanomethylicaceae archaeon]
MNLKKSQILITGGAGFIGSHLVDALLALGAKVIVYDNFDDYYLGKEDNIKHNLKNPNFRLIKADILNYDMLLSCVKKSDIIFHLAAQPGVRFSMNNPEKTIKINIIGTLNVLKAAEKVGIKKFIFASSSSVYGNPVYMPVDEKHQTNPISIYGLSKLTAERICKLYYEHFHVPIVILRYFTVYGPRQRPDMAIYKWVKTIFEEKSVTIYGDGNQTRDFTFINDIVNGTIKAAEIDGIEGEVFNLGGGSRVSINEVVKMLINLINLNDVKIMYEAYKLGDVQDSYANISKARKLLSFNPTVKLEEGLKNFINWYKQYKLIGEMKL